MTSTTTYIFFSCPLLLVQIPVQAFPPLSFMPKITFQFQLGSTTAPNAFDQESFNRIDLKHAHECADNFGECSVGEMEAMYQGKAI